MSSACASKATMSLLCVFSCCVCCHLTFGWKGLQCGLIQSKRLRLSAGCLAQTAMSLLPEDEPVTVRELLSHYVELTEPCPRGVLKIFQENAASLPEALGPWKGCMGCVGCAAMATRPFFFRCGQRVVVAPFCRVSRQASSSLSSIESATLSTSRSRAAHSSRPDRTHGAIHASLPPRLECFHTGFTVLTSDG